MILLHGRIVVPIDAPEIKDGAVAVDGPLIVGCGPYQQIHKQYPGADEINLTDCLLLPGLINAHTHLELSHLKGLVSYEGDFIEWIIRLITARRQTVKPLVEIINGAVEELVRGGVTTVADICYEHRAWPYLKQLNLRKICYAEVFGLTDKLEAQTEYLHRALEHTETDDLLRLGLSPHAPYSAGAELYELAARLAGAHNSEGESPVALTTHLAETPGEIEFLTKGGGVWLEFLQRINRWDGLFKCPKQRPVEYFLSLELQEQRFLLAHVNYISDEELSALAQTRHSVVFCPRSHHFFGHPTHRFGDMLAAGINVCFGTDSLASNNTLSILDEMRFVHQQYPKFSADTLIKMGTINGAVALGWEDKIGSIACGKEADLVAIPLTGNHDQSLADILKSETQPKLTMVAGKIVHQSTK